jgi:putative transposase
VSLIEAARPEVSIEPLCDALQLPRASYYRLRDGINRPRKKRGSPRAFSAAERQEVLDVLHSERFIDCAPPEIYASLLDEGRYVGSVSTMYRILAAEHEVRERRDQARHPKHKKPELVATAPNQVWSWDITRIRTYTKWSYFYLYVILDIFSRFVVGWMLADRENARLAKRLITESVIAEGVNKNQLILHSDRGSPMVALTTAQLLARLQVTPSYNRPATGQQRQPLLRGPISDAQVPSDDPEPDRVVRRGTGGTAAIFSLLQLPAPPQRHRLSDAGDGPLRHRQPGHGCADRNAGQGIRTKPRTIRPRPADPARAAKGGLDQSTTREIRWRCSLISQHQLSRFY